MKILIKEKDLQKTLKSQMVSKVVINTTEQVLDDLDSGKIEPGSVSSFAYAVPGNHVILNLSLVLGREENKENDYPREEGGIRQVYSPLFWQKVRALSKNNPNLFDHLKIIVDKLSKGEAGKRSMEELIEELKADETLLNAIKQMAKAREKRKTKNKK